MKNRKKTRKHTLVLVLFLLLLFIHCGSPQEKSISNGISIADSCCKKVNNTDSLKQQIGTSMQSEITCPKCGNKKMEIMPTDICLLSYTCQKCQTVLHPKEGDCCVFCTYGDHKCPSMQ